MRTIYGSDYTIIGPDAYTFIFAPNILTVTLGTSYAANQLVTLVGNGVTLSRRAINRVAIFDLMPILETPFTTTDFAIVYSASPNPTDPLYRFSFNTTVTAGASAVTVPFEIRWGALQHDDAFTINFNNNITFPYWTGKPLVLNTEVQHSFKYVPELSLTANPGEMINIPTSTNIDFTFAVGAGSTNYQVTNFKKQTCPADGRYLRWIDQRGRIWHYMFNPNRMQGVQTTTAHEGAISRFAVDYTDSEKGQSLPQRKLSQRSFQCFATVDNDIYHIVSSIVKSPFVHWFIAGRWVRVTITPTTLAPDTGWMSDIEFTVELPTDYTQRL